MTIRDTYYTVHNKAFSGIFTYYMSDLTIGISHFLFTSSHVSEVVDDGLGKILQFLQLHLHRLQLLRLSDLHSTISALQLSLLQFRRVT